MTTPGEELLQRMDVIPGIPDSVLLADPLRFCASYMLDLMNLRSDAVVEDRLGDGRLLRVLDIECGSPFSENLGLCLNDEVYELDRDMIGDVSRIDMEMTIGDTTIDKQVSSRFIQLRRSNGELFGVTGLSKEISGGRYEQWHAITMRMIPIDDHLHADLWATTYTLDSSVSTLLVEQSAEGFGSYQTSMYKALGRTSRR